MNMFSIWPSFGFRENPYSNHTLPGDDLGDRLLVGRDTEVATLQRKIGSTGTQPTVEGRPGIGKTSLIAVAGYRMFAACIDAKNGTLFLPANEFFQASTDPDAFEAHVLRVVAQTLIQNVRAFEIAALNSPDLAALDKWMNNPIYRTASAEAFGFGAGGGSEPNTSEGFSQSGFADIVKGELARCFPTAAAGAIVCVVDNLELLQTSSQARDALDVLRDRLFNLPGLRWVLAGSRGMVTHARSERLSGIFEPPMQIGPLADEFAIELIERRVSEFGDRDSIAPVPSAAFEYLYQALHQNLRDALAYAQKFSDWLYDQYTLPGVDLPSDEERRLLLEGWLASEADDAYGFARVQPRVWKFFQDLAANGGRCNASEWAEYEFTTQQQLVRAVTDLASANLVVRETDPDNASRTVPSVTPQGWLVYFHLNRYEIAGSKTGA